MESIRSAVEWAASGIEVLAVLIIVVAVTFGTGRFLLHLSQKVDDAYKQYKVHLAKALLLVLEFMVAADIIRTVVIDQTLRSVSILGILVLIRTFLSWSLTVEIEERLPWSKRTQKGEI
jgi:uncharacterized membrane protein